MAASLPSSVARYHERIERCLSLCFAHMREQLDRPTQIIDSLIKSMEYSSLNGGKRLRASLVYLCAESCASDTPELHSNTTPTSLSNFTACDIAATAVELIHCYSLVHDDLPAMDDDDLRRGKPTNHKVYGEANAILAGDALQTLAFELLANQGSIPASLRVDLMSTLTSASGVLGMVGGQYIDLSLTGKHSEGSVEISTLTSMHRLKTGALISAAARLGGLCADASAQQLRALQTYGEAIGLAFQIQDDLLDLHGDSALTGKQIGMDIAADKTTFPALLGEQATREAGEQQFQTALQSLDTFDNQAESLRQLARYIIDRDR